MRVEPSTELMYLKGVGPHRAELLARRGLRTFEDLLGYLPFRYEDRIHFAKIREIVPGQTYTIQAEVSGGSLVGIFARARRRILPGRAGRHGLARLQIFSRKLS